MQRSKKIRHIIIREPINYRLRNDTDHRIDREDIKTFITFYMFKLIEEGLG